MSDKMTIDDSTDVEGSNLTEFLTVKPNFLARWGVLFYFLFFSISLVGAVFIEYPDIIPGRMMLNVKNIPKAAESKIDSRIEEMFVADGGKVKKGDMLFYLENNADRNEVQALNQQVIRLSRLNAEELMLGIAEINIDDLHQLGQLQNQFDAFKMSFLETERYITQFYMTRTNQIKTDIEIMNKLNSDIKQQMTYLSEDLDIEFKEYEIQTRLFEKKVISSSDQRKARSKYLLKQQGILQAQGSIHNNFLAINQKKREYTQLDNERLEKINSLLQLARALKSAILAWQTTYYITAPIDGDFTNLPNIQKGVTVRRGQRLAIVTPTEQPSYYGEIHLSQRNSGKIQVLQDVAIKFDSYPFEEYGTVRARVNQVSKLPTDSTFYIEVAFPNGIVTSSGYRVPLNNGLTASAEIIIKDQSLFKSIIVNSFKQ